MINYNELQKINLFAMVIATNNDDNGTTDPMAWIVDCSSTFECLVLGIKEAANNDSEPEEKHRGANTHCMH